MTGMSTEYVVEVEVQGFAAEGMKDLDGTPLTRKQADAANQGKLDTFEGHPDVDLVEHVIREDDGSGILRFRWDPEAEDGDHGAVTWMSGKGAAAHVLSVVAGAGFLTVEHRIVAREASEDVEADSEPSEGGAE